MTNGDDSRVVRLIARLSIIKLRLRFFHQFPEFNYFAISDTQ
jgi:hypothetical protein